MTCLALNDPTSKLELETFSQSIHIPKVYITKAEESTPSNYNLRWSGLSFTLGEVIIGSGQAHGDWHSKISGTLYICACIATIMKLKANTVLLSSSRSMSGNLGEREMLRKQEPIGECVHSFFPVLPNFLL